MLVTTQLQTIGSGFKPVNQEKPKVFHKAAIVGNFLIIPVIVWGMVQFLPDEPAIQLGVSMVLLVPCTDWFITFTHLGGGDTKHAIAFSPISLLLQIVLLPLALVLPPLYQVAVVAIVFQSLVELIGMVVYLWMVPTILFPQIKGPDG